MTTTEMVEDIELSKEIALIEDEVFNAEFVEPEPLSEAKAKSLDKKIRTAGAKVDTNVDTFKELLEEAALGQIHVALGLKSWTAYFAEVSKESRFLQLAGKSMIDRKVLAVTMSEAGMSQRAIAGVFGVSQKTIDRDLEGEEFDTDTVTSLNDRQVPRRKQPKADVIDDAEEVEEPTEEIVVAAVELVEQFDFEAANLHNAIASITDNIMAEPKWPGARKRVAKAHLNNIGDWIAALQTIADDLTAV